MRLGRWGLVVLGLATLVAASLPLWPASTGVHAPSATEAIFFAALGIGCLLLAAYFTGRDRRERAARRLAEVREPLLVAELTERGVIEDFVQSTQAPCLRLTTTPEVGTPDPFASRIGGVFYSPPGFAWPRDAQQRPMWPLAQLNFAELPHLDGYPDSGILQFFITADDDLYGMDLDDLSQQSGFRVVYHPEVGTDTFPNPAPRPDELNVPFRGTLRLSAQAETMPMTLSDWRFEDALADSWQRGPRPSEAFGPDALGAAYQAFENGDQLPFGGHRVGGYAAFVQEDPRTDTPSLQGHSAVLLQIDSIDDICWGDAGIACFLIEPERLRRRDFSNVLYTWDCG